MFTTKILTPADLSLLLNVPDDIFDNPVDENFAHEFLEDPRHHIVVALSDGAIIGFASAVHYIHPDKAPELFINEVGVSPAHQNKGVGKAVTEGTPETGTKPRLCQRLGAHRPKQRPSKWTLQVRGRRSRGFGFGLV